VQITIDKRRSLQDEPLQLRVVGATPGTTIDISLRSATSSSRASFVAGADGVVDLERDAPVTGTYEGVDPMGLMWSLDPPVPRPMDKDELASRHFEVTASGAGTEVSTDFDRDIVGPDIVREPLRDEHMVGTLFRAADGQPRPGLVVLGGSEGGLVECWAALLASRGYTALALAYFGIEPLPPVLSLLPLEYIARGITWLRDHEAVAGRKVGIAGASKGGELVLQMAATFPDLIDAVVGVVPSGVTFMGIGNGPRTFGSFFRSSWTQNGAPVPFVPMRMTPSVMWGSSFSRAPMRFDRIYETAMLKKDVVERATIPIECFKGPILLESSEADAMWPSTKLADIAASRHPRCEHIVAPGAGHLIALPYDPAIVEIPNAFMGRSLVFGGTRAATARAAVIGWRKGLDFLAEHLG
jgi:fermentation-respiration switch protein FrsA (DUF1100 family)